MDDLEMHAKTKELEEQGHKRRETMATKRKEGTKSEEHTLNWEHAGGLVLHFEARYEAMNPYFVLLGSV